MRALLETTDWTTPNHVYFLDGDRLLGYAPQGQAKAITFVKPIRGFDRRYRTFKEIDPSPWGLTSKEPKSTVEVAGSKPGVTYIVDLEKSTCTCPGFQFRGTCRHIKEAMGD